MKSIDLYSAIRAVDDDILERSETATCEHKKKNGWLKWGAMAACLCLILTVAIVTLPGVLRGAGGNTPGGGNVPGEHQGGIFTEGVDPIIESMAVYPATEDIRDVKDATMESIDETTAYGTPGLGDYLPTELPTGYHFDKADLYETTMKSGTQYHMLRVTYAAGSNDTSTASTNDDGGMLVPTPNSLSSNFAIFVMDFEPKTKKTIYHFEDLPEFLETAKDIAVFHFSCGDMYIGFTPSDLSTEEILTVVNSIPNRGNEPT